MLGVEVNGLGRYVIFDGAEETLEDEVGIEEVLIDQGLKISLFVLAELGIDEEGYLDEENILVLTLCVCAIDM